MRVVLILNDSLLGVIGICLHRFVLFFIIKFHCGRISPKTDMPGSYDCKNVPIHQFFLDVRVTRLTCLVPGFKAIAGLRESFSRVHSA